MSEVVLAAAQRKRRQQLLQGQREIARLSTAHPLTGYDRNVLQQWEKRGCAGARPPLSFELRDRWNREAVAEQEEIEREAIRVAQLKAEQKEWRQRRAEERAAKERWRQENPDLAAAEDAAAAAKERARRAAADQRRAREQRERELDDAILSELERIRGQANSGGPHSLSSAEFLIWCEEIASPEDLEAFDRDCLRRARPRSPLEQLTDWLIPTLRLRL